MKKLLFDFRLVFLCLAPLGLFFEIFIFEATSDFMMLLLTGLWVLSVWLYKFESRVSIAAALVFLALCPFLFIFNKEALAEEFAIWAFMFLVVGVFQQIFEGGRKGRE